jgi:hypothetical protein
MVGHVDEKGRVYRKRIGPDDEVGHVDQDSGKVYAQRLGKDRYIGRVDLDSGKVWRHVAAGPDEYMGRVHRSGRFDYHLPGRADQNIGRIEGTDSLAHAAAAFLLLVWPAFAENL